MAKCMSQMPSVRRASGPHRDPPGRSPTLLSCCLCFVSVDFVYVGAICCDMFVDFGATASFFFVFA